MKLRLLPALLFISLISAAQVPATLSYQGLLTDNTGSPVADGAHTILFNFYTLSTGGTAAFNRGPMQVNTFKGLFTVILGNGQGSNNAALPANFGDTQYYIGITPDGQTELTPLVQLTSVPYAFRAQYASAVDGAAITTGTVPNARLDANLQDLADGSLSGAKIGAGINAANVTTGTLPASVIPTGAGIPAGTIVAFGGETVPAGWLECDGRSLVTTGTYAALYAAVGNLWGQTDATHFSVPYLYGYFLRGWSHAGGPTEDPDISSRGTSGVPGATGSGNHVGSYQGSVFGAHSHTMNSATFPGNGTTIAHAQLISTTQVANNSDYGTGRVSNLNTGMNSAGGNETRPKNVYVMYIIKY